MQARRFTLPIIVLAQFCCTSLWFASNGVLSELIDGFNLEPAALSYLTSAVQFGFITGTLAFAALTIADRFSPSVVFFICAILGAITNLGVILEANTFWSLIALRFGTGFFLAGIYPVGMKIAADYFEKGLGKSLGFLVGALVLGTAFPHILNAMNAQLPWQSVLWTTSILALTGGVLLYFFVPDGPFRKKGDSLQLSAFLKVFKNRKFRSASFGYFGHMWELYAFWAFVPTIIATYNTSSVTPKLDVPLWSFIIIGIGSIGCIIAGVSSAKLGTSRLAVTALLASCVCCLLSPLLFEMSPIFFLLFLLFWGLVVIADSPLFSTMVAHSATPELKGTALTITNCIGFAITIISIQFLSFAIVNWSDQFAYMILAFGPIIGLVALSKQSRKN